MGYLQTIVVRKTLYRARLQKTIKANQLQKTLQKQILFTTLPGFLHRIEKN